MQVPAYIFECLGTGNGEQCYGGKMDILFSLSSLFEDKTTLTSNPNT